MWCLWPKAESWKKLGHFCAANSKQLIIAAAMVITVFIYVFGTRYSYSHYQGHIFVFDRLTGKEVKESSPTPKTAAEYLDGK